MSVSLPQYPREAEHLRTYLYKYLESVRSFEKPQMIDIELAGDWSKTGSAAEFQVPMAA